MSKAYCEGCHFELRETENQYCQTCTEELEQMIMDQYRAWEREKRRQASEPNQKLLLSALNNLLDAVEELEGQSIEYDKAINLSAAAKAANKVAIEITGNAGELDAYDMLETWEYLADRQLTYGEQRGDIQ